MNRYLYTFGYETPQQVCANRENGWDDEDSRSVVVIASSEAEALTWGREISEAFVAKLFWDSSVSWKGMNYAHGVEPQSTTKSDADDWQGIPVVVVGQLPSWAQ